MKLSIKENLSAFDQANRIMLGVAMTMSILLLPYESAWIAAVAIAATYPLVTGLTAIDPILSLIENTKFKPILFKKPTTPVAH